MALAPSLSRTGRLYLATIVAAGFTAIAVSVHHFYVDPIGYEWFLLAALTLLSGSASVHIPASNVSISISETFVFTAVLLYGPAAGTLIVALDALVMSFWLARRKGEPFRILFNISAPAVSAWISAHFFFYVAGIQPLVREPADLDAILPALVAFAVLYFALNSWLIAFIVAFEKRVNAFRVWKADLLWLSLNYFCGASVAVLIVVYNRSVSLGYLGVIIPLLLVLYFTFKTAMSRVEDSAKHLEQLNALYLSTIETLAMAIDAKDQITHGHIRRVQSYAVGLAARLGIKNESLIKAIEAAALLHDTGKLVVPEYILNKPGKLTAAEFEKMKLHAAVGADILSAIDFPYPVVPIVRHHHENWDGTGYPAGLKGTDIPIGARILAVVDCYDALTSDRPYRAKLHSTDAMSILFERRGKMYDPLIVDAFARAHADLAHEVDGVAASGPALEEIDHLSGAVALEVPRRERQSIASRNVELLSLYRVAYALTGHTGVRDLVEIISRYLLPIIPFSLCVYYVYDSATDEIVAACAAGDVPIDANGIRMAVGQRLSGWVAANRQTIVNSDPVLDLGDLATCRNLQLRSCLSSPVVCNDELVGVLTLYSTTFEAFTSDQQLLLEVILAETASAFHSSVHTSSVAQDDLATELPRFESCEEVIRTMRTAHSLILVRLHDLASLRDAPGQSLPELLRHFSLCAKRCLRAADILFRYGTDEFILWIAGDDENANTMMDSIQTALRSHFLPNSSGAGGPLKISWARIPIGKGDLSLSEAILQARIDSVGQVAGSATERIH